MRKIRLNSHENGTRVVTIKIGNRGVIKMDPKVIRCMKNEIHARISRTVQTRVRTRNYLDTVNGAEDLK